MSIALKIRQFSIRLARLADALEQFEQGKLTKEQLAEYVNVLYDKPSSYATVKQQLQALLV